MAGPSLGTAYVQIVPSAQGIKGSITNVLGGEAESAGTSLGGKIGSFAKKAIITAGIGTIAVKGIKAALDEGAKLQQSYIGGVETLYGEAAEAVREHAKAAASYGISMNDYSEQAVSFGAALKQAYGGDAVKAAKAADMAIQDMADNQAKMGTDIGSIQQAYAGFARGQYQLLDNLKLGYGGTRSEMQRLLSDAEAITGVHYDIDNLGDVYEAIHVIQGELGLTGVAASEASTTFSGSFGAMKAAAQNFLGSLALGEGVSAAMADLANKVTTFFFGNFLPMLGQLVLSIPPAIGTFLQQGLPLLIASIQTLLTNLSTWVSELANSLTSQKVTQWLMTTLPQILAAGGRLIQQLATAFITNLPRIVSAIATIGANIVTGLGTALWGKVQAAAQGIVAKFMEPINTLTGKIQAVVDAIKSKFPIKLGNIFDFKIPQVDVGSKTISVAGKDVTVPTFSISWHAKGGIFQNPTLLQSINGNLHGVGERGPEAIIPLNAFWKKMDEIAANTQGGNAINIYINGSDKDPRIIAEEVKRVLIKETNQRRLAWQ